MLLRTVTLAILLFAPAYSRALAQTAEEADPPANLHLAARELLAHFERADAFLADEQWEEAVMALRTLAESRETGLVPTAQTGNGGFHRYTPLSQHAHRRLAALHYSAPEALALYRSRVDPFAAAWLKEGLETRNEKLLLRIVEQAYASSHGDEALYALGEAALDRGDHRAARRWWEQLHPALRAPAVEEWGLAAGGSWWPVLHRAAEEGEGKAPGWFDRPAAETAAPTWLCYPDADFDLAQLRAQLILVSLLEGDRPRAELELAAFRRWHPESRGRLGGREGSLVELLDALFAESAAWPPPAAEPKVGTFAGNYRRAGNEHAAIDVAARPAWKAELLRTPLKADRERIVKGRQRVAELFTELLSLHPVVHAGRVFVARPGAVHGFNLATGEPAFPRAEAAEKEDAPGELWPAGAPVIPFAQPAEDYSGVPRYTLTVDTENHLYARMGSPVTATPPGGNPLAGERSMLIGLDLEAEGRLLPGFPLTLETGWEFDGAPIVSQGRLFVVLRRGPAGRPSLYVACYEAVSSRREARRLWLSEKVCDAQTLNQHSEISHTLLALAGDTLYLNTNLGAIAALAADTGRARWVATYPRTIPSLDDTEPAPAHLFRDLTPCLVERGWVVAAPADSNRILFLEATTGRLLAATPPADLTSGIDAIHLLGVAGDRLICSGDYLWWIDMHTGGVVSKFPQSGSTAPGRVGPSPSGYGRGVLGGGLVYWPTRTRIYVFDQHAEGPSPTPRRQPIDLNARGATGGNLCLTEGHLILANAEELFVFPDAAAQHENVQAAESPSSER